MKNWLWLFTFFLLVLSSNALAQHRKSLWFEVLAGAHASFILNQNAYGNPEMPYASKFGLAGGVGLTYFKDKRTGFNGSLYYNTLGQNYAGIQGEAHAERKVKLDYIELPLTIMKQVAVYHYPTWISFGPDVLILLNATQHYSRDGGIPLQNPEGMISADVTDRFNRADVAVTASVSRFYDTKWYHKTYFLFTINTAVGITDINKSEWQIPNPHQVYGKSHNFYLGFKIGMMFEVRRFGIAGW